MIDPQAANVFRTTALITVIAVYFLILVGGIVRASGAGMGCPDWPTCFGRLIPPTQESQLPADYHQRYAIGYKDTAFNPVKTWTEYLNRLTGVCIGLLIFLTAWRSRIFLREDKAVFYLSLTAFFLVGFQGWLGSAVVASKLTPLIITLHMLVALVIVALLIYVFARSQKSRWPVIRREELPPKFMTVLMVAMGMTIIQIMMGTQIRETVDVLANEHSYIERRFWRNDFPIIFYVHRSFSSLILFTNAWMAWKVYRQFGRNALIVKVALSILGLIVTAILTGIAMDRLGMPAVAQPLHLLMANLIFGTQFLQFIILRYALTPPPITPPLLDTAIG
jgi:heme a synthase